VLLISDAVRATLHTDAISPATTTINMITERTWTPESEPGLEQALIAYRGSMEGISPEGERWAIMLGAGRNVLIGGESTRPGDGPGFAEYILRIGGIHTLFDAHFALEAYYYAKLMGDEPADPKPDFPQDPLVDDLLRDSRGWLLWQYQLENICGTILRDRPAAIEMRRRLNQKRSEAWEWADSIGLPSGRSLGEVMWSRLALGGAVPGRWSAARTLFDYLAASGGPGHERQAR
jgi:hypothetical protein